MTLRSIDILNFKNIREASLAFCPGINCLLGRNGMGKSNLLEAVHFLSMARGMGSQPEASLITHGLDMLMVKGEYLMESGSTEEVSCGLVRGKGKTLRRNGKEYARISQHIGAFPIVTVAPADIRLVEGSAEERRRLVDVVLSQSDAGYLSQLIRYGRALESRNRMLRAGVRDKLLYESVEEVMADAAASIHASRTQWVGALAPVFESYYSGISGGSEKATIGYRSQLDGTTLRELLDSRRAKDTTLGYTSAGVHRDDLSTGLDGYSMRNVGSQGQVKTYTIALRLAIFDYLRRRGGITPILLLDDIFDKLDASRVERIMQTAAAGGGFGQIFVTDTNRHHLDTILEVVGGERLLLEVNDGRFDIIPQKNQKS